MKKNGNYWHCRYNTWQCIGFAVLAVVGFAALVLLFGLAIMWLWNTIASPVFGLGVLTYWQAVGLAVLARLLFGAGRGWHHRGYRHWRYYKKQGDKNSCNCNSSCSCGCANNCNCGCNDTGNCNCGCNCNCCCKSNSSSQKCDDGTDCAKWSHYDQFWAEEGEKLFDEYVKRKTENK